ncbi:photosynthetic NDH subunit of lumenal location 3, chloroplastic [Prosopis cineraria]|uniref:photosynthetic NDH subunit of lumenal location 3, chloroplastic n=1 Tax=Prosopis cineraria TaxID=364024 RepID=UPI00240FDA57|nr:photosynthetic NDH subunit of lumenal location 3, chloroplastic [Prosopis cineraria]
MTSLANLSGVSNTFPPITNLPNTHKNPKRRRRQFQILGLQGGQTQQAPQQCPVPITRRAAIGLVSFILTANSTHKTSLALDNGFWYEEPLPSPSISNQLANTNTGTRSFLKKGIYMANIGVKGSVYRIKKYAFDLLAMADLVAEDTLNYVRKYLRLKSTFMYYDFDKVISAVSLNDKQPLMDMANKLFDNFEKLEDAARRKNFPDTKASYQETSVMLHEVMDRMSSLYKTI